jgi:hypothetical protein
VFVIEECENNVEWSGIRHPNLTKQTRGNTPVYITCHTRSFLILLLLLLLLFTGGLTENLQWSIDSPPSSN